MTAPSVEPRKLEEAVALLRARGFDARCRDWAMGRTVAVPWGASDAGTGIVVRERVGTRTYALVEPWFDVPR